MPHPKSSEPTRPELRHRRIVDQRPRNGQWRIACSCGWDSSVGIASVVKGTDVEKLLEQAFKGHLTEPDKSQYLLVDQRMIKLDSDGQPAAVGTFLMPEGAPVQLAGWFEADGEYWGRLADGRTLLVGEVRTAAGRVLRAA